MSDMSPFLPKPAGSHEPPGTVVLTDAEHGTVVLNQSDIPTRSVYEALAGPHPEVAALIRWTVQTAPDNSAMRQGGVWQRDRYVVPEQIFSQYRLCQDAAANDDVVSNFLDTSEAIAFGRMDMQAPEEDEENIWNQIAYDIDLPTRIREMWRELCTISQFYAVTWWGRKDYRVQGESPNTGVKRKKTFNNIVVPLGVTILDPIKVVPVGNLMFNQEQLCYIADRTEVDMLDAAVLNDPQADEISRQIIIAKYAPPDFERRNLARQGINAEWLYILNPRNVWRHTVTRPQYRRFAEIRMLAIMELLDLKHQLRQMDRAHLIGGTNFIVLIRKGTDHLPARPEEVQNLQAQVQTVARLPILVGDHRLSVDIVTPKTDYTLDPNKYATLDNRLLARLYQQFIIHGGEGTPRSDDALKLGKTIARGMESRRWMMKRTLERQVFGPTVAANPGVLTCEPELRFHPARIELDWDPSMVQFTMDLRQAGEISRRSALSLLDLDEEDEAMWRKREAKIYDAVFTPVNVPFTAPGPGHQVQVGPNGQPKTTDQTAPALPPNTVAPHSHAPDGTPVGMPVPVKKAAKKAAGASKAAVRSAGRTQGGNRNGGGAAPGTGQGQAPRRGRPSSK